MPARAIDCFCIVGIWHILLDDVKSAARPTATGRWTADTACESLHSAPSKADAAPGLHPCACTANVAFGPRVAAAAFKSPRRTALCISPFSFNIPNNPSLHPSIQQAATDFDYLENLSLSAALFPTTPRARADDVSISTQNQSPRDFIRSLPSPSILALRRQRFHQIGT